MLPEFEEALARGQNLQQTRERLIQRTEDHRRQMLAQIEQSVKEAQVIEYGLTLPRDSPAYGTAKGIVTWFRKKYPTDDSPTRELMKTVWMSTGGRKGVANVDKGSYGVDGDETEKDTSGTAGNIVKEADAGSDRGAAGIPETVQSKER